MQNLEKEWFNAARGGDDKRVAELLAEHPNLIEVEDQRLKTQIGTKGQTSGETALHYAAQEGHEAVVVRLLAARPVLFYARNFDGRTALDLAASKGHDKVVAQMLATTDVVGFDVSSGLWEAVRNNHDKVVDLLLTARSPNFTLSDNRHTELALFSIIKKGDHKNFTRLLAIDPSLIDAVDPVERITVLHQAAMYGRDDMVSQILTVRPQMIDVVSIDGGCNVLTYAVQGGHPTTAQTLLAIKPELIFHVSKQGNTVLHYAVNRCEEVEFVAKLWRLNPQALTHANNNYNTPFHLAVFEVWDEVIELFQWSLSFDDIVSAFTAYRMDCQEMYGPVMEQLLSESLSLNRDVVGTVLEYVVGMGVVKKRANKRMKLP